MTDRVPTAPTVEALLDENRNLRAHVAVLVDAHDSVLRIHSSRTITTPTGPVLACRECMCPKPCPTEAALGYGL